eukprot:m.265853 g.265853  ORF g.265853 m.265853 type:complete len:1002 (+) comp64084_c0_seq1:339-3344(+)
MKSMSTPWSQTRVVFTLGLLLCSLHVAHASSLKPRRLRVEYLENPITIDTPTPRFSWALSSSDRGVVQLSYHIVVTHLPAVGAPVIVWDSGAVETNRTLNIPYAGSVPLLSDADYTWSVVSTDSVDRSRKESDGACANFSTAIIGVNGNSMGSLAWRDAQWISSPVNGSYAQYRTEFHIANTPIRSRMYISGLGYAKTWLNGNLTDNHELGQFVTFQERVLYDCVDVTKFLVQGTNALGLMLGLGWFGSPNINAGPRQFMLLLSVTSSQGDTTYYRSTAAPTAAATTMAPIDSVTPDVALTFVATTSPVVFDGMTQGEVYDGRIAAALEGWNRPGYAPPAKGGPQWIPASPPIISPVNFGSRIAAHNVRITTDVDYDAPSISQPAPGKFVHDFGQNMAGQVTIELRDCPVGTVISLQHAEILYPNGLVHDSFCERPKYWLCAVRQFANYTCGGGPSEMYRVTFVYMGFRYVQVTGFPGNHDVNNLPWNVTAHFIHSEIAKSGAFSSSSPMLNAIQHATRFSAMSNAMDIPTDCPQREKAGWLGDAQLAFDTVVHNFDTGAFYTKWIHDLADTQAYNNATLNTTEGFAECAPYYGHGHLEADPGWGIAAWKVPMGFAAYYDDEPLERAWYPHARGYMEHWITLAQANNGLFPIVSVGDWGNLWPGPQSYQPTSYAQFFYIVALDAQVELAQRFGFVSDSERYSTFAKNARALYLSTFYNKSTACYGNCSDVEQIFALTLELQEAGSEEEAAVWANALAWFDTDGKYPERFGGGIISLKLVYPLLDRFNRTDLGLRFQLHTDAPPSFGYWVAQNATTLFEYWTNSATTFNSGLNSFNHIMYGGSGSWYYSSLGGLQRAQGSRSWTDLVIAPPSGRVLNDLTWANASIDTPMGFVSSAWVVPAALSNGDDTAIELPPALEAFNNVYTLLTTLPPNAKARIVLPTIVPASLAVVTEGGNKVWDTGVYVSGTAGIKDISVGGDGHSLVILVGSGSYNFASLASSAI